MTLPTPSNRATGADPREVTNWNWTIADFDRLEAMVRRRTTASQIADAFGTTAEEEAGMTKLTGIEKLHPQNHDLYRRVQHLVALRWSWEGIADDAGLVGPRRVQDLCEWVLAYREPKKLPMVATRMLPVPVRSPALLDHGVRLAIWQRQNKGAREALKAAART